MKHNFHVELMISTTGNHTAESVNDWLVDLIRSAMASKTERNSLEEITVKEVSGQSGDRCSEIELCQCSEVSK